MRLGMVVAVQSGDSFLIGKVRSVQRRLIPQGQPLVLVGVEFFPGDHGLSGTHFYEEHMVSEADRCPHCSVPPDEMNPDHGTYLYPCGFWMDVDSPSQADEEDCRYHMELDRQRELLEGMCEGMRRMGVTQATLNEVMDVADDMRREREKRGIE